MKTDARKMSADADPRVVLEAMLRFNFHAFGHKAFDHLNPGTVYLPNWHTKAIHWHLDQIRIATLNRLIIAMPPRSGKSIAASVALPAFLQGHDPRLRIITVSYAQDLAAKLHNDYRRILRSDWYRRLFPRTRIDPRKDTESQTDLTGGGSRVATSVGGVLTGLGADVIILDDPLKAADAYSESKRKAANDWYDNTLLSRLNDKKRGAIVIVSQRLHMDDLIGHAREKSTIWEILELPAIAPRDMRISIGDDRYHFFRKGDALHPEREPVAVLEQLRKSIGSDAFSAQYLQEPVPPGGNMFRRDWVRRYSRPPTRQPGDEVIQSWDTASKEGPANDWSVCTTWLKRDGSYYLIDLFRDRLDYPALKKQAIMLGKKYGPRMVLVEDTGIGTALIAELRRARVNVRPVRPTQSKQARASVEAAKFEGGRVFLPERAPWLNELQGELFAFPGSRHDDQVDSIVQALAYNIPRPARTTVGSYPAY